MKIERQKIKSSSDTCVMDGKYSASVCCIKSAIDELCAVAENDEIAKEAIANLSVVLLDLKSVQ